MNTSGVAIAVDSRWTGKLLFLKISETCVKFIARTSETCQRIVFGLCRYALERGREVMKLVFVRRSLPQFKGIHPDIMYSKPLKMIVAFRSLVNTRRVWIGVGILRTMKFGAYNSIISGMFVLYVVKRC